MPNLRFTELIAGVACFAVAYFVGTRSEPASKSAQEPLAVAFVPMLVLGMISAAAAPSREPGVLAAGLGILATQAIWAIERYPSAAAWQRPTRQPYVIDLWWGVRWGLGAAVFFSLYVTIVFAVFSTELSRGVFGTQSLGIIIGLYFTGGLLGGLIASVIRPLGRWPLGAMAMGTLVLFPIYEIVALALPLIDRTTRASSFTEQLIIGVVCALLIGPPVGLSYFARQRLKP